MKKTIKSLSLLLAAIMLFVAVDTAAGGVLSTATGENSTVVGNVTVGENSTSTEFHWTTNFGNFTVGLDWSPKAFCLDLTDSSQTVEVDNKSRLFAQLYDGPLPTGTDKYARNLDPLDYLLTLDLDEDDTEDLAITSEYQLIKLPGAQNLKKSFTFTYPGPSETNVVFFNPITINVNKEEEPVTGTNTTGINTTGTNTTGTNTTGTNTTGINTTGTNITDTNTTGINTTGTNITDTNTTGINTTGTNTTGINTTDTNTTGTNTTVTNTTGTDTATQPENEIVVKKNGRYEIRDGYAVLIGVTKKSIKSLTVQDTVTRKDGKKIPVTEIAAGACAKLSKLTKLTIGKNVKTIGAKAFYQCKKLKTLIINAKKLTRVASKAFQKITANPNIRCPKGKTKSYTKLMKKGGIKKAVWKEK